MTCCQAAVSSVDKFRGAQSGTEPQGRKSWIPPTGAAVNPDRSMTRSPGIGTPAEFREHMQGFADVGVDQVIFLQQGGKNRHEHICESLERFRSDVYDDFAEGRDEREREKAEELAPFIEAALARRDTRPTMTDADIPIVPASRPKPKAAG